jgi:imidazolonepropionase-like amidohydrolase
VFDGEQLIGVRTVEVEGSRIVAAAAPAPAAAEQVDDRGRAAPGARADLLLVDGDPTSGIARHPVD